MFTTLQKEYALIFYIRHVLGQANNNGFLHELYTEKNIREIVEALVKNKVKDQATISVEQIVDSIMSKIRTDTLVDPNKPNAKFNVLPFSPVSLMELYMGKTIDNALLNMQQRIFVDDITDAKDGLAAYFMSCFTRSDMVSDDFIKLATLDKHPSVQEFINVLSSRYPRAEIIKDTKQLSMYASEMVKNNFTHQDLNVVLASIRLDYHNILNDVTLLNAIRKAAELKEADDDTSSFDDLRDRCEKKVRDMIKSTADVGNLLKTAGIYRFAGTMKYIRGSKGEDGSAPVNTIEVSVRKQDRTDSNGIDVYTQFVTTLNKLLAIENLGPVESGTYRNLGTVIMSEAQYRAIFPEYFVTFGIIKDKLKTETEMGKATMKSGDEAGSVIDNYTGEEKFEQEYDDSFDSTTLTVEKTKKLMFAKMLATLNGHPEKVPDQIEPKNNPNSVVYDLNRILVRELFNSPYETIQGLVGYLTLGELPPDLQDKASEMEKLREKFLNSAQSVNQEMVERDAHVMAFATILSQLSKLAQMDPDSRTSQHRSANINTHHPITLKSGGKTYSLNNLPTVVNLMAAKAMEGKIIASITLTDPNPLTSALNFLEQSGLLMESDGMYTLETDNAAIKNILDGMEWLQLPSDHYHNMMPDALRNCSYIYKHNGWTHMSPAEMKVNHFTKIENKSKAKTSFEHIGKFVSMIEDLQTSIKPYVFQLRHLNEIIERIRQDYGIDTIPTAEAPTVDDATMSVDKKALEMLGMDESMESVDRLAQGYFLNKIIERYENAAKTCCSKIKEALRTNKMLNEQTRKALISKFNRNGSKTKLINTIFDGVKKTNLGIMADDSFKKDIQDSFTLTEHIIMLYNKVRTDVMAKDPTIASSFPVREYVNSQEIEGMTKGHSPSGKLYNEGGLGCQNDFLLNAYLIDILFETVYLLTVNFNLAGQNTYTVQEVLEMDDIKKMQKYINDNIQIAFEGNLGYQQLVNAIIPRLRILFNISMLNMVVIVMSTNPQITKVTGRQYRTITGYTNNMTSKKVLSEIEDKQNSQVTKRKKANWRDEFMPMDDED